MNIVATEIPEVLIVEPRVFGDDRGFFYESFNQRGFRDLTGLDVAFIDGMIDYGFLLIGLIETTFLIWVSATFFHLDGDN